MADKAFSNIQPCNIGTSEAHNKRTPEYLAHFHDCYIRKDFMERDVWWQSDGVVGGCLASHHEYLAALVKDKTNRKMQTTVRQRKDKNGRVKKVNGCSDLREEVVRITPTTTLADVQRYASAMQQKFGITPLQIALHFDEGHSEYDPQQPDRWTPNLHAHIVYDWINHETGITIKMSRTDTSKVQDMAAEYFGLERGISKAETGAEHLSRNDFIIKKQTEKQQQLDAANAQREEEGRRLESANEQKRAESDMLDAETAEKRKKKDKENGNAILSGVAKAFGKGRYEEIEKENEQLKAEVPQRMKQLEEEFETRVEAEVQARTKPLRDKASTLTNKTEAQSKLIIDLRRELKSTKERYAWKDTVLLALAELFHKAYDFFREAIKSIIDFARATGPGHQDIFSNEQASSINQAIDLLAQKPTDREPVGKFLVRYADHRANLNDQEFNRADREVADVANGRYDRIINGNQTINVRH